jgi:transcriptional regulator with XRE-family HTH domain
VRVEELVGRRIRDIRDSKGMTQEQLGIAIGELLGKPWPRQTVSSAEAGRRAFTAAELVAIAHALGVYAGYLFTPAAGPIGGIELSPGVELKPEEVLQVLFQSSDIAGVEGSLQSLLLAARQADAAVSGIEKNVNDLLGHLAGGVVGPGTGPGGGTGSRPAVEDS